MLFYRKERERESERERERERVLVYIALPLNFLGIEEIQHPPPESGEEYQWSNWEYDSYPWSPWSGVTQTGGEVDDATCSDRGEKSKLDANLTAGMITFYLFF